jgi:hypothetical protein
MTATRAIEGKIAEYITSRISGSGAVGVIECEAEDASAAVGGTIELGLPSGEQREIMEAAELLDAYENDFFTDLLLDLREASRARPLGPFYRCHIHIGSDGLRFEYFWEEQPFTSVKELVPRSGSLDGVPSFVLARRFDRRLIDEISDFDVANCLLFYVPARVKQGKPISESLLEVYATMDWQWEMNHMPVTTDLKAPVAEPLFGDFSADSWGGDTSNGSINAYFQRELEPMTELPMARLYAPTLSGLRRIGCDDAAHIFAESLALFAHFFAPVEAARAALGIPPVRKPEQSDIMYRYQAIEPSLEPARVAYIRAHIEELEQKD